MAIPADIVDGEGDNRVHWRVYSLACAWGGHISRWRVQGVEVRLFLWLMRSRSGTGNELPLRIGARFRAEGRRVLFPMPPSHLHMHELRILLLGLRAPR